jgi:hypothetical protein
MLPGHPHRVVVASLNICRWGVGCNAQTGREWQSYDPGDKPAFLKIRPTNLVIQTLSVHPESMSNSLLLFLTLINMVPLINSLGTHLTPAGLSEELATVNNSSILHDVHPYPDSVFVPVSYCYEKFGNDFTPYPAREAFQGITGWIVEEMGFEADLVRWAESFMEEKKVMMSMDGKEGDSMDVETGVLQGSPVSPVIFVIYLSGLFGEVEKEEEECESEGISFVDDVAWVVEGGDVGECTQRLERCAAGAQKWGKENACQFHMETTEAILFTQRRKHKEPKMKAKIRVGNHEV